MTHSATGPANQARILAQSGQFGAARAAYSEALRQSPGDADLLIEAGYLEVELEQIPNAIKLMSRAVQIRPDDPDFHFNLAEVYRLAGNGTGARKHFLQVIQFNPGDGEAHHALAELAVAAGDIDEANDHIETANRLVPNNPEILNMMGIVYEKQRDAKKAEESFSNAIRIQPNFIDALCNLGGLMIDMDRISDARRYYERADAVEPLSGKQLHNLYSTYHQLNLGEQALEIAQRLTLTSGNNSDALVLRANAHEMMGNFDAAERDLRASLLQNVYNVNAYANLGTMHKLTAKDIQMLEKIADDPKLDAENNINLWFTLYRAYQTDKNYEKAFDALKRANDLKAEKYPMERADITREMSNDLKTFDKSFFTAHEGHGFNKPGAIFVVGMPRSGTTLTERVLAAHPKIFGAGERREVPNIVDTIDNYPHSVRELSKDWAKQTGRKLHRALFSLTENEKFVVDKLPGNYSHIGLISMILPNAKFIYCKRDPMDNCLSCYEQNFSEGLRFTFNLETLAETYRQHERLMAHWAENCPIPIHTVRYEDLVSDPEPTTRAMLDYIGVEWDDRCLNPEDVDSTIVTASIWQARQPINTGSVGRWKRYETQLQPLLAMLQGSQA